MKNHDLIIKAWKAYLKKHYKYREFFRGGNGFVRKMSKDKKELNE